jgi:hypothetical protein
MKKRLEGINKDRVIVCELEDFLNLYSNGNITESIDTEEVEVIA